VRCARVRVLRRLDRRFSCEDVVKFSVLLSFCFVMHQLKIMGRRVSVALDDLFWLASYC
jgi:hypothetical protein